jgi:hypothetical protein
MKSENARRGRPTEFTDAQLRSRRDQLVQAFENSWGEIGWELSQCKKADELLKALSPLLNSYADLVSVLCRPSDEMPDWAALRKARSKRRSLVRQSYAVDAEKREAHDELRKEERALAVGTKAQRRILRQAQKERRNAASEVELKYRNLAETLRNLKSRQAALEASVARYELFRFLKSRRYSLTPLSLANAVANVPCSGWRQSMRRCRKQPCMVAKASYYQIFKAIRYLTIKGNKRTGRDLAKDFRARIPALPSRYRFVKGRLAEHWFYIERAIQLTFRANPILSAMPFKIMDHYLKQLRQQTQAEVMLAAQLRINLSKRRHLQP